MHLSLFTSVSLRPFICLFYFLYAFVSLCICLFVSVSLCIGLSMYVSGQMLPNGLHQQSVNVNSFFNNTSGVLGSRQSVHMIGYVT